MAIYIGASQAGAAVAEQPTAGAAVGGGQGAGNAVADQLTAGEEHERLVDQVVDWCSHRTGDPPLAYCVDRLIDPLLEGLGQPVVCAGQQLTAGYGGQPEVGRRVDQGFDRQCDVQTGRRGLAPLVSGVESGVDEEIQRLGLHRRCGKQRSQPERQHRAGRSGRSQSAGAAAASARRTSVLRGRRASAVLCCAGAANLAAIRHDGPPSGP